MQIDNSQFSPREKEVLELLLQGKSNKEIALALNVSVSTIEFHLKNVYSKLQVKSRTEAVLQLRESTGGDKTDQSGESIGKAADKQRESIVDGKGVKVENDGNTIPKRRILVKKWLYVIGGGFLLAVVLAAAVLFAKLNIDKAQTFPPSTKTQVISPSSTETQVMAGKEISFEGNTFTLPPNLGDRTLNEYIQQSEPDALVKFPMHLRSVLENYPLRDTSATPRILIFPAKEFAQMYVCNEATISKLENMLAAQRLSGDALPFPCDPSVDTLPFLPDQLARQIFHAQEKILSFQNGTGIRYITQHGQAALPTINNTDLVYTFQGLTSDGKYYISVILPINSADLPEDDVFPPPAEWEDREKYLDYLKTTVEKLRQAATPFNPSLDSLDALVQSLQIAGQN